MNVSRRRMVARLFAAGADKWLVNSLAVLALCIGLSGDPVWLALTVAGLAATLAVAFSIPVAPEQSGPSNLTDTFVAGRVLTLFLVAAVFADTAGENEWWPWQAGWVATFVMAATIVAETAVVRVGESAHPFMANHPGANLRNASLFSPGYIFWINIVAVVLFAASAASDAPGPWLVGLSLVAAVPSIVLLADGLKRFESVRKAEQGLHGLLSKTAPVFAVYWDAPSGTEFQLGMWLPHLERLDLQFIVVVRNPDTFHCVAQMTTAPVLFRRKSNDLDAIIVPSLKTAFYVNNAMRNSHFVRYAGITHIQLNHGDSDKAPSYNPVIRMFDKNFVAGQAAIDRFEANGVPIPPGLCLIVGRPQVEGVEVGPRARANPDCPVVLYAPTWDGHTTDSNHSSLPIGYEIVRGLLDRKCTVIFRPHPYTKTNASHAHQALRIRKLLSSDASLTGRTHVWNERAGHAGSLVDHFNSADALISDVSSVISDFLFSEKPFAMTVMHGTLEDCAADLPIARAAYLIDSGLAMLEGSLDALVGEDSLGDVRRRMKTYYLGEFPDECYADAFLDQAHKFLV